MSMDSLFIGTPNLSQEGDYAILSAPVHINGSETKLWFRVPAYVNPSLSADPFFAACLIPAMALGKTLKIASPISASLLCTAEHVQDIFHNWYPELARVSLSVNPISRPRVRQGGVGCFFSGGVDSLYTFLKHEQEISTLVYVHGFDVKLDDGTLRKMVSESLRSFSNRSNKNIIEVETNLRDFTDQHGAWGEKIHGAALACIGLLLDNFLERIYVPSTNTYADLFPWASHPLVDPLWSTETIQIIHDGCEASRFEKIATFADDNRALSTLRVCWENRNGAYNCGECEKCLRTMAALEILSALNRCPTFSAPLNLETIRQFELTGSIAQLHWNDNYKAAVKYNRVDIATALKNAINQLAAAKVINSLSNQFADIAANPRWDEFTQRHRERLFLSLLKGNRRWVTLEVFKENIKHLLGWTRNGNRK
jgi:hypothetical protein